MPLRIRLALIYVVLLAAALATFSLVAYLVAAGRIYGGVDDALGVGAQGVLVALAPIRAPVTAGDIARGRARLDEEASVGAVFQIRDLSGQILYASSEPASRDLPRAPGNRGARTFITSDVQGRRLRILYEPIVADRRVLGNVEVAQSLDESDEALSEIQNVFILGGVGILLLTSVSAYILSGRGLDPVRQLSHLARDIEHTADFGRRLRATGGGGEIKELVSTFNAMIERLERMLQVQRAFLADSSHELRRPLTVLRTNIDVLSDPSLPESERAVCLREMHAQAETMGHLVSDLLLLSREEGQAIERAIVDYSSLCEEAIARLRGQDDQHVFAAEVAEGVRIFGDGGRLAQMLSNLLDNAARYTPEGGRIELRLGLQDGVARLEVQDTGMGIPAEDLPQVFERFYRGEGARASHVEGAGLGLAIVKYIAEAHDGTVSVISEPGRGSTFRVDLPTLS